MIPVDSYYYYFHIAIAVASYMSLFCILIISCITRQNQDRLQKIELLLKTSIDRNSGSGSNQDRSISTENVPLLNYTQPVPPPTYQQSQNGQGPEPPYVPHYALPPFSSV